jgi:Domain of unknown function (DUF2017)
MVSRRRFTRDRHGKFHPRLSEEERELLEALPSQALALLAAKDESTRRLFPVAYPDDPGAEREYQALVGESLLGRHRRALDTLIQGARADTVDHGELEQWMAALEVLRLVLGTKLDVQEDIDRIDPADPRAPELALYAYLSMLQEEVVFALAGTLPVTREAP